MVERITPDAVRQVAVKSAEGWAEAGVSPRRLRTLTGTGDLVRQRRGVYATRAAIEWAAKGPREKHRLDTYSVLVAVGFDAVVSHQSAAFIQGLDLLGLREGETPAAVTLTRPASGQRPEAGQNAEAGQPAGRRRSNRSGISGTVCYAAALPPEHVHGLETVEGLDTMQVTTVKRTVIDLARMLPFMDAVVAADSALRVHPFMKSEYEPVLDACSGWPGAAKAREVMEFAVPVDSPLESCLRIFLRDWGFDPPETHATIHGRTGDFIVDFLFRKGKTVVEADGELKYKTQKDVRKRLARDEALHHAGYKVAHVTWDDAFTQPNITADRIRKALAAPGPF